jgi:hypothetical protein
MPFIAGAGVAGVAIGFAAKDTLSNLIAGVLLIVDRPFEIGDRIEVWNAPSGSATWGDVIDIGLRATKIRTTDNIVIVIPNNKIMTRDIINYTLISDRIRVRINVGIAYDADVQKARDILVELAKTVGAPVLAANAPRRYVNRVSRLGKDALSDLPAQARETLPPLPFPDPTPAYRAEWNALMSGMSMEQQCPVPEEEPSEETTKRTGEEDEAPAHAPPAGMPMHGGSFMENGLQAQTLWDASMAHTVTTFLDRNPGALVVHMVGGFHVKNGTGTPEKIQFYRPGTRSLVVHMDLAEDIDTFDPAEHGGRGDFVVLTDESLDLNYQRNCVDAG